MMRNFETGSHKYEWNGQTLVNPTLVLDLPAVPGPYHDGGKLIVASGLVISTF